MGYVPKILIEQLEGYNCTVKSITKKYVRIVPDGYPNEVYSIVPKKLIKIQDKESSNGGCQV